jgi:S-adenosylhomocysteine hydrolase
MMKTVSLTYRGGMDATNNSGRRALVIGLGVSGGGVCGSADLLGALEAFVAVDDGPAVAAVADRKRMAM